MADNVVTLQIINAALYRLGERPITGLDQGTHVSDMAKHLYPIVRDDQLVKASWSFATVRRSLNVLAGATPPSDFDRYFVLPTEPYCLQVIEPQLEAFGASFRRELYVNPSDPNDQISVIATDEMALTLTYLGRVSEGVWHPAFIALMVKAMGVALSQALTGKASLTQQVSQEYAIQLVEAKNKLSQEGTPRAMPMPRGYLDVRGLGGASAPTHYWQT